VIPALALILYDASGDRNARVAQIQEDAERIVEMAASRQARFIDSAQLFCRCSPKSLRSKRAMRLLADGL
jgi:hypothetical protein